MSPSPRAKVLPFETKASRSARTRRVKAVGGREKEDLKKRVEELEEQLRAASGFRLPESLVVELTRSLVRQRKRVAVLARSTQQPLIDGLTWIAAPAAANAEAARNFRSMMKAPMAPNTRPVRMAPPPSTSSP